VVCLVFITTRGVYIVAQRRDRVVRRTDHQAVLAACRELMSEIVDDKAQIESTPGDPQFDALPEVIRAMRPNYVLVRKQRVDMSFGGGFFGLGLVAYPDGSPYEPREDNLHQMGRHKLLDGLWYWEF
jgi:hypothetical protein